MAPDLLFLHVLHRMTAPARPAPPCGTDDGELSSPPPPPRRPEHVIPAKAGIQDTHHPLSNTPLSLRGGASPTWQSQPPAHPVPPRRPFTLSPPSYPQSLHVPDLQTALPPHAVIPAGPLPLKSCQDNLLLKSGPITLTSGPSFSVYIRANPWFLLSSPDS